MNSVIKINNIDNFSSVSWKNVKKKTEWYLNQFYSYHDKLTTSIFPSEIISELNINESGFKIIKKEYTPKEIYFQNNIKSINESKIIKLINEGVEGVLKLLHLEVISKLVMHCNEKNKIEKFKLNEEWTGKQAKETAKEFCNFLLAKRDVLIKNNKLSNYNKKESLIMFIEPDALINLLKGEANLLNSKRYSIRMGLKPISSYFSFIQELHLNMKISLDKEYNFNKIIGIFLPLDAVFIKKLPVNVCFRFLGRNIRATITAQWALKLVPDNIYIFY